MDWIKKNYDKFFLAVSAVVLIGVAAMLFLSAGAFGEKFAEVMTAPPKSDKIPEVDTARITEAKKSFDNPVQWTSEVHEGLLFTSESYVVKDGKLVKIKQGFITHSRTGETIENKWLIQYGLSAVDRTIGLQDPDGDGFLTEDEAVANPKTDPTKKDSHPPYHTQLFLTNWRTNRFRWRLQTIIGDSKNDKAENLDFQINTLDMSRPTDFLKIGATVSGTPWKLKSFQFKEIDSPGTGDKKDASELTLVNTETSEEVVLPIYTIVDSPTQNGDFEYRWNKKPAEKGAPFTIPRLKEFTLPPDVGVKYKLLDGNQEKAVIQLPDGQKYEVPRLVAPTKAPPATTPPTK
jgi:hypothetical protein